MSEYGGFQVGQELAFDGLVTTYRAARGGADGDQFILKRYEPPPAILGTPRAVLEVSRFLEAARVQGEASQRTSFLAQVHVGVLSLNDDGRGPLTAPVWYDFDPGDGLWFLTGHDSRKKT